MRAPSCAVELAGVLGGRWRTVVLAHLKEGARTGVVLPAP
ncbi:DNA-binding HxlR family transcriptional regulator [Spirilliplanes yamanashiensis]|nr:DNA-binding HxlR family transcriptional regulator [Spirilliplanes yamanashiensis]